MMSCYTLSNRRHVLVVLPSKTHVPGYKLSAQTNNACHTSCIDYIPLKVRRIVTNELEGMWKEAVVSYFKVFSQHFLE
jgi:hypothetical protein